MWARFIYSTAVKLVNLFLPVLGLFSSKIKKISVGRKFTGKQVDEFLQNHPGPIIWFHCASMGEWEQAIPVVRQLKKLSEYKIMVSFFSPSGYEHARDQSLIDLKVYLPTDLPAAYQAVFGSLDIKVLLFVRYDLWPNLIRWADKCCIPLMLIGAEFGPNHRYVRHQHSFLGSLLPRFSFIAANTSATTQVLKEKGFVQVETTGSPKIARVAEIKNVEFQDAAIERWLAGRKAIVAGSVWIKEIEMIAQYRLSETCSCKWIIAPHDVSPDFLYKVSKILGPGVEFFSQGQVESSEADVLVVDTIGMLAGLYRYGYVAIIGGGFGRGIHNILEPAVYGIPVISGPRNQKFSEASTLQNVGVYFPVTNYHEVVHTFNQLLDDDALRTKVKQNAATFFIENKGAGEVIADRILTKLENHA